MPADTWHSKLQQSIRNSSLFFDGTTAGWNADAFSALMARMSDEPALPPSPLLQPPPLLGPTQRRVVSFALTLFAVLGSVALLVATLIVIGRSISFFSSVLWPLAAAGVIALILRPVVDRLERRLRLRRLSAVIILYGLFAMAVAGLLLAVLPPLIDQTVNFVAYLPTLWENVLVYVRAHYPQWIDLVQHQLDNPTVRKISEGFATQAQALFAEALPSLRAAGGGLMGVVIFFTHIAIIPVYLFFFLLARREPTHSLPEHLSFLRPSVRDDIVFLVREFVSIIESFFRGQLLIGLIMGALLAVGFTIIGLKFGLFIGLMLGVLNIVPYLGTIIGLAVTLPLAFFQPDGGWKLIGLVLLVKLIVQAIESWILTPKIMGAQTGLHPAVVIIAVFFWGTAFDGILGMLLAIPLTAFFVTAWRLARYKYLRRSPIA
jgi:predicted PurR-regulated permease PerM